MHEIFGVVKGRGEFTTDGVTYHEINEGDWVIVRPGEPHGQRNSGTEPFTMVFFGIKERMDA